MGFTTRPNGAYVLSLLSIAVLLLAACTVTGPEEPVPVQPTAAPTAKPMESDEGRTLRILYWQAPTILNPHLSTGAKDWDASRITLEPLASYDKDGTLIPFLAAEIPSLENGGVAADGKSVTWKLKQDIKWSDGEPFTADDVLFTYEFISDPETGATSASEYAAVESVEVIGDFTVKVNFKDVNPAWSLPFVGVKGMILPRHAFEGYSGANVREAPANKLPIGTGPYRVIPPGIKPQEVLFLGTQLVETNKIVYEPNPYYPGVDQLYFNRVEMRGGGTADEAARSVLETGDVDYADYLQVDAETLERFEAAGKGRVLANFGFFVERIVLNRTDPNKATADGERSSLEFPHPFLTDEKVRQAISYAIDREAIAELYGLAGRPATNMLVSPATYNSPNTTYEFNLTRAAALLDEADWRDTDNDGIRDKDGVKLSILFQTSVNPVRQASQDIVKKDLESIGFEVELKIVDSGVFFGSDRTNPNTRVHFYADLEMYQTGNRSPDPGAYMKWWTCDEIAQMANNWTGNNVERWCNATYDELYTESTVEMDPAKRRELFIQMNDLIVGDIVEIPLVHRANVASASNTLEGIDFTPWDASLWNIKDWRRVSQ